MKEWLAGLALLVGACDKPMVKGCEDFIISRLKSPSTYKRISVDQLTEKSSKEGIVRLGGGATLEMMPELAGAFQSFELRKVLITYEANNSFNAPLRSTFVCAFEGHDGEEPIEMLVDNGVSKAKSYDETRRLVEAGALTKPSGLNMDPNHPCCLDAPPMRPEK
ncbi:MAG: hypothetical protein ACSLE1_15055 [Sphingobium sp.]